MGNINPVTNGDLGANEWLADEMFEAFQKDPNSVDPAWVEYFRKNGMTTASVNTTSVTPAAPVGNPIAGAPNGGVPPTSKASIPTPAPVAPVQAAPVAQPVVSEVATGNNVAGVRSEEHTSELQSH